MTKLQKAVRDIEERMKRFAAEQNIPLADAPPPPTIQCQTCGDLGYVWPFHEYGHPDFGKCLPCPDGCNAIQKVRERHVRSVVKGAGIPPQYQKWSLADFERLSPDALKGKVLACTLADMLVNSGCKAVSRAEAYAIHGREWKEADVIRNSLILTGDYGVGKTALMCAVANGLMEQGVQVLYIRTQDFIAAVQATYSQRSEDSTDSVLDAARRAQVLALDEFNLSGDAATANRQDIIEAVIRYRHANNLATIITTNMNEESLRQYWGNRTMDVLLEMAHYVPMVGVKLRRTMDKQNRAQETF